jgi:hypothetical protein
VEPGTRVPQMTLRIVGETPGYTLVELESLPINFKLFNWPAKKLLASQKLAWLTSHEYMWDRATK